MRLLLARHGETEYNRQWRYQGRTDLGLNRLGQKQAESLRQRLAREPIDLIYTSGLRRAAETAGTIARGRGVRVVPCQSLAEIDFGRFEGMTYEEITEGYPEWQPGGFSFAEYGGENLEQMARRIGMFLEKLRRDNPEDANVLIVAHSGPLRVLLCLLLGIDIGKWRSFRLMPTSLTVVEGLGQSPVLTLLNDVSHLK
jgi:alpha-ribazole phosphatase